MTIILRTCESVKSVNDPRTFYKNKTECIIDCVSSLFNSISKCKELLPNEEIRVVVVEDELSSGTKRKLTATAKKCGVPCEYIKTKHGNVESFTTCVKYAVTLDDSEFVLFVEDDYKVEDNGIYELVKFRNMFSGDALIINPVLDCNDFIDYLYDDNGNYESSIVLPGENIYWKRVRHMTKTFGVYVSTLKKYWKIMEEELAQKKLTSLKWNKVTDHVPTFSPMSVIFRHMQADITMDWFESKRKPMKYCSEKCGLTSGRKEIIVSMTTMPWRCDKIMDTVESIANGTMVPDKMVLYLCHDDFKEIPNNIVNTAEKYKFFEVHWADANYGPATKLLPAIKEYPNSIIINVDDDYTYKPCLVENLYNCWKSNKNSIITNAAHVIGLDSRTGFLINLGSAQYNGFDQIDRSRRKGFNLMFLSGHGTLYPPHVFDNTDVMNNDLRNKHWSTHDELWFWMNVVSVGVETVVCGDYVNMAGHGWVLKTMPTKNPLWARNNPVEKQMLEQATFFIRERNPGVLKYFENSSPNPYVHTSLPNRRIPRESSSINSKSDTFVPPGFEINPTLNAAEESKRFTEGRKRKIIDAFGMVRYV